MRLRVERGDVGVLDGFLCGIEDRASDGSGAGRLAEGGERTKEKYQKRTCHSRKRQARGSFLSGDIGLLGLYESLIIVVHRWRVSAGWRVKLLSLCHFIVLMYGATRLRERSADWASHAGRKKKTGRLCGLARSYFWLRCSEGERTIRSGLPAAAESAVELHQGQGLSLLRADQIQLRGEEVGVGG